MKLDVLEDWIALDDVCDLREGSPLLRWLRAKGLLDLSRLTVCDYCRQPFVQRPHAHNQRFCSVSCRQKAYRPIFDANNPGRTQEIRRASYYRIKARRAA